MILKHMELTEKQAIEISKWKYEGKYEMYNLPDWDTMVKGKFSLCSDIKRKQYTGYINEESELVGFTNLLDEGDHVFYGIGVNPKCCSQGIGKLITKSALEMCKERFPNKPVFLEVRTWNERAINCYKSQGFEIIDIKKEKTYIGIGEFYVMKCINEN